ncbi:MAG: hypothetical protein OEV68_09520 [candidate division Zixibacteria bacterium]|nr:hypothetical protein [candidate division Zixibacteria bacterium]
MYPTTIIPKPTLVIALLLIVVAPSVLAYDTTSISYGYSGAGAISPAGEYDVYYFDGEIGDVVLIRMSDTEDNGVYIDPRIELYDPSGSLIASDSTSSFQAQVLDVQLESTGTFKIVASDWGDNDTRAYGLSLQCVNTTGYAELISYGYNGESSIAFLSEMDAYQFDGTAGDVILIRMSDTEDNGVYIDPRIELYDHNGVLVASHQTSTFQARIVDFTLPSTGTYTLIASDINGEDVRAYGLGLQCVNTTGYAELISYGYNGVSSIAFLSEMDAYQFEGTAGDVILIRMSDTEDNGVYIDPQIELYDHNGVLVASHWTSTFQARIVDFTLPSTGTYTLIASDINGEDVRAYGLGLQCVNCFGILPTIRYSTCDTGRVALLSEMDGFQFVGSAGDSVIIRMSDGYGNGVYIDPRIELFDPDGERLADTATTGAEGSLEVKIDGSGLHTVIMSDFGGDDSRAYDFSLCNPDPEGCYGIRGNVNGSRCDCNIIDISDLVFLIDYMFQNGPEPPNWDEADINGSGTLPIDISDLVYLIDYMFSGGPPPPDCP